MFKNSLAKGILSAVIMGTVLTSVPLYGSGLHNSKVVYAATKKVATCTVDKLKVRTDSGTEFAQLSADGTMVYLSLNDKADVLGEKKDKSGVVWYKVKFLFNDKSVTGFVRSDFVKIANENASTPSDKGKTNTKKTAGNTKKASSIKETSKYSYKGEVKTKGLRLRTGVGTDKPQYKIGGTGVVLPNGQVLNITGEKNDVKKIRWYKISTKVNGKTVKGYVLSEFVKLSVDKKTPAYAKVTAKKGAVIKTKATAKGNEFKDSKGKKVILAKNDIVSIFHEITLSDVKYYKVSFVINGKTYTGYLVASQVKLIGIVKDTPKADDTDNTGDNGDSSDDNSDDNTGNDDNDDGNSGGVINNNNGKFVTQRAYITSDKVELYNEADYKADILKESETGIPYKLNMNQEVIARKQYTVGNEKWYLITYIVNDSTGKQVIGAGFVPEKYIKLSGEPVDDSTGSSNKKKISDKAFEKELAAEGFPEDYKPFLRVLHRAHPYWHFEARHLGLDWEYAVSRESVVGLNLLQNSSNYAWKSMEAKAYDWANDAFIAYDGSTWVTASNKAVRYYMDPRNFLNEDYIYQFELLTYKPEHHTEEGISAILGGPPMRDTTYDYVASDGTNKTISYAETFLLAGVYSGVSPYHLASRVKQEVAGAGRFSSSVTGTVPGYEGYYNFYNIGAYNNTAPGGAVASGLKFAANGSSSKAVIGNKSFNDYIKIPWNNRYSAILGGAAFIGNNYILRGQNTPYLEKFNFTEKNTFSHQYMSAVFSPSSESMITKRAYAELKDEPLVFSIPVFQNMPPVISERPVDIPSPNNWLSSLQVTGYQLTPAFRPDTTEGYNLVVGKDVDVIEVTGKTANKKAVVNGFGQIKLTPGGVNVISISVTAEDGTVRTYKINVAKEE